MKLLLLASTLILLVLPQTGSASELASETRQAVGTATQETSSGINDALLTPLADLNLVRKKVPPLLASLTTAYEPVADVNCARLTAMIGALDSVLGPDANDVVEEKISTGQKVGSNASKLTLGAVTAATGRLIPVRGVVRTVTGAAKRDAEATAAFRRGAERRAFLKGMGAQLGCDWWAKSQV